MKAENIICRLVRESSDCTSFYDASFKVPPTFEEFMQYLIIEQSQEWGYIALDNWLNRIVEYRWGKIVSATEEYDKNKDKRIVLHNMHGGWSRMDYVITISR